MSDSWDQIVRSFRHFGIHGMLLHGSVSPVRTIFDISTLSQLLCLTACAPGLAGGARVRRHELPPGHDDPVALRHLAQLRRGLLRPPAGGQEERALRQPPRRQHHEDQQREGGEAQEVPPPEGGHDRPGQQGLEAGAGRPEEGQGHHGVTADGGGEELGVQRRHLQGGGRGKGI